MVGATDVGANFAKFTVYIGISESAPADGMRQFGCAIHTGILLRICC